MTKKTTLITGATSGIGLTTAAYFLDKGFQVLLSGRNQQKLEEAQKRLLLNNSAKSLLSIYLSDVSKLDCLVDMYDKIKNDGHTLDCLVINAAIASPLPFELVTEENFDQTMNINLKGAFFTLQKALPLLSEQATVVFVTSIANQMGSPNFAVYAAAKAALRSLVKTVALELIEKGIRVNAVSPGPITTPMYNKFGLPDDVVDHIQQDIKNKSPIKRFGESIEVAKAIYFLSSDDSSYIVGDELVVDGGMSLL